MSDALPKAPIQPTLGGRPADPHLAHESGAKQSGPAGGLRPLLIGSDHPPVTPPCVPILEPPPRETAIRPLPVIRDTRWRRIADEAEEAAAQTIRRARQEAARIIDAARRKSSILLADAQRILAERLANETEAFRAQAAALLASIEAQKQALLDRLEYDVAALVADMAGVIVHRKIAAADSIVLDVVRDALSRVADAATVSVVVSPSDETVVRSHLDQLTRALQTAGKIKVVSADDILRGGCIVRADDATVDARIDAQIERTKARLMQTLDTESLPLEEG